MADGFNIEAVLTEMSGKINLIAQSVETNKEDMRSVRQRVHDLSNDVQRLLALNLQGTIDGLKNDQKDIEMRVVVLERDLHERRGAVNMAKVVYGIGGTTIGAAAVALLKSGVLG